MASEFDLYEYISLIVFTGSTITLEAAINYWLTAALEITTSQ